MRDLSVIIDATGASVDVPVGRDDAAVLAVVSATGSIGILLDGGATAVATRQQGEVFTSDKPFRKLRLTGSAQTVLLSIGGPGEWSESNKVVVVAMPAVAVSTTLWSDNAASSAAPVTIAAAGSTTLGAVVGLPQAVTIALNPAAPGPVYVGSLTVGTGIPILPGESLRLFSPDAVVGGVRQFLVNNPNAVGVSVTSRYEF